MKLAEGLLLRADLQKKIAHLNARIIPVTKVTTGKTPQEDPIKLMATLRKAIKDFEAIVVKINKTNNVTPFPGKNNLMEALAERDALKMLAEQLRSIRQGCQLHNLGYSNIETTIDVKSLQIEIDQVGRAFREIDSQIQQINWLTELQE